MEVMGIKPDAPTHEMVTLLAEAVGHLADAFRCLGSDDDATQAADDAIKSQRRVEHAYRPAMSALLQVSDLREVTSRREIYPPTFSYWRPRPHSRPTSLVLGGQKRRNPAAVSPLASSSATRRAHAVVSA